MVLLSHIKSGRLLQYLKGSYKKVWDRLLRVDPGCKEEVFYSEGGKAQK